MIRLAPVLQHTPPVLVIRPRGSRGRSEKYLVIVSLPARAIRAAYPTGRDAERSELKRAFCSSLSPS